MSTEDVCSCRDHLDLQCAPEELRSIVSDLGIDLSSMPHKRDLEGYLWRGNGPRYKTEVKTSTEELQR